MIGQIVGIGVLGLLASTPLLYKMYNEGTWNIDKPEKRTYMFETEDGEQYNPFESPEDEELENEWKYSPGDF